MEHLIVEGNTTIIRLVCLQVDPGGRLDVMVWFHGGGFVSGAGSFYGPEHLLDEDIVLVTVNYRLGPIGKATCISLLSLRIILQHARNGAYA